MNIQFEIAIIGLVQAVMVAVIAGLFARDSRKRRKALDNAEVRAMLRAEESMMSMEITSAGLVLGMANAKALKNGSTNGTLESALNDSKKAYDKYQAFIQKIAAQQIANGREHD